MSYRKCGACSHDPACGSASVTKDGKTIWYCHDNDHSCYEQIVGYA